MIGDGLSPAPLAGRGGPKLVGRIGVSRRRTLPSPSPSANPVGITRKARVSTTPLSRDGRVRVVVATTVLLSFISFWRAAAIVLSDLGSTAFYVGGIVEQAVGKAAPWFILGVMLFSYAVRARLHRELRDVRARRRLPRRQGGDGRHAGQAVGVGAAVRLRPDRARSAACRPASTSRACSTICCARSACARALPVGATAAFIAILITVYFWWRNTQRHPRVERRRAAHHEGHHRHGRHPDRAGAA